MKMFASTIVNFEAAHSLQMKGKSDEENKEIYGKCYNVHGHNYKLFVTVEGSVQEDGMIINFRIMREIIKQNIVELYDHKYINEIMDHVPTAENMCTDIWNILEDKFTILDISLYEIKLYETDNSFVTLRR